MKIIPFVWKYIKKSQPDVIRLALCCIVLYFASMLTPYITGKYIDGLTNGNNPRAIWLCVGILAIVWTLQILLSYAKNMAFTKVSSRVSYHIEEDLIEHVKRLPLSFFIINDGTYIGHRIVSDSLTVAQFVLLSVVNFVTSFLSLLVSLVAISIVSPYVFLIMLAASPLYGVVYYKFRKPIYELSYEYKEQENKFFSNANRQFSNIKPIKQHVYYERLHDEMRSSYDRLYLSTIKHAKFGYLFGNAESFLRYIVTLAVFIFSGYGIIKGKMSIGCFTMVNSYTMMAITALSGILGFGRNYRSTLVSYNRINTLYDLPVEHNGTMDPGTIEEIKVKTLSFRYDDRALISHLSCTMTRGHIYGILGANGSGKTTFVDLITGIIDGYSGTIHYNGYDLRDIDIYELRQKRIAIVEQEPSLMVNSIKELVAEFGKNTLAREWLDRLGMRSFAEQVTSMDFDEESAMSSFSGGEKQKLALARAFAKKADVIILDEPSSAIDHDTLEQLISIIQQLAREKIIIIITHEPQLAAICDEVIAFIFDTNAK